MRRPRPSERWPYALPPTALTTGKKFRHSSTRCSPSHEPLAFGEGKATPGRTTPNRLDSRLAERVRGDRDALSCYSRFVDDKAQPVAASAVQSAVSPTFAELAARQGVSPIGDFESLLGEPSPEDESAEEFSACLREWRREGTRPVTPQ